MRIRRWLGLSLVAFGVVLAGVGPAGAATLDGATIHSTSTGQGPKTVILVHGWTCDESPHELGTRFQLPEQFEDRREEIFSKLEPIETPVEPDEEES